MELKLDPNKPQYEYIQTREQGEKALDELEKAEFISIDCEATALDPYFAKVLVVQVGTEDKSFIFDTHGTGLAEYQRFKDLLQNPKKLKLLHNAKFDYQMLKQQLGIELINVYDTMLAELALNAGLQVSVSLLSLTGKYLNIDLDKEVRKTFEKLSPGQKFSKEQLDYAALDTLVLFPIFREQWPKLQKEGLIKIAKLEFAVTTVVGDMELNGIHIDVKKWRDIINGLAKKRKVIASEFQELVRPYFKTNQMDMFSSNGMADSININSQVQLMDLFNNRLNLGLAATGEWILSTTDHPVAKKLLEYRKYEKLISAFGEGLLEKVNRKTGRLHPDFQQLRTATGRFACSNPNLQQIPRNQVEAPFRECFTPEPGYKLVTADYSNMEMRILADLSGDTKMINAIKEGLDIHSYTAALMFNKEYTTDFRKKYPELRQISKPIGFGLMYGMGPSGLAQSLEMETGKHFTKEQGAEYIDKYFSSYPSVKKFLEKMANDAVKKGWSTTPAGRKRWYDKPDKTDPDYNRKLSAIQRQAKNHPIQGTNADATKYALVFLAERIKKEGADVKITHTVHDEIVCEVRNDQAEDWAKVQTGEMIRAGELFIKKVPVESQAFVGDVWEH